MAIPTSVGYVFFRRRSLRNSDTSIIRHACLRKSNFLARTMVIKRNTSSGLQVSVLIPRPLHNRMEMMCQRHVVVQNSQCNQFIIYYICRWRVLVSTISYSVILWSLQQNVFAKFERGSIMTRIRWESTMVYGNSQVEFTKPSVMVIATCTTHLFPITLLIILLNWLKMIFIYFGICSQVFCWHGKQDVCSFCYIPCIDSPAYISSIYIYIYIYI